MSFSAQIKQELNKTSNLVNKELVKYELIRIFNDKKYRHTKCKNKILNRKWL
jgi:hypothetical protein